MCVCCLVACLLTATPFANSPKTKSFCNKFQNNLLQHRYNFFFSVCLSSSDHSPQHIQISVTSLLHPHPSNSLAHSSLSLLFSFISSLSALSQRYVPSLVMWPLYFTILLTATICYVLSTSQRCFKEFSCFAHSRFACFLFFLLHCSFDSCLFLCIVRAFILS